MNSQDNKTEDPGSQTESVSNQESPGKDKLRKWLNKNFRIKMTDGRIIIGVFVCTDRDANIILGSCSEFLNEDTENTEERILGLVMVPGRHIVSIQYDDSNYPPKKFESLLSAEDIMTDYNTE